MDALAEVVPASALAEVPQVPGAGCEFALPIGFEESDQLGDEVRKDEAEEWSVVVHTRRVAGASVHRACPWPQASPEKGVPCRSHRLAEPGHRPREDAMLTLHACEAGLAHGRYVPPGQIHRSRHTRGFTVLPNTALQDRRLSYTARGLLADLLFRPDDWCEDGRRLADTTPRAASPSPKPCAS
jgi:hypothetical protein